jgi:hypothetical protein
MTLASIGGQVKHTFIVFFDWLPHLVGALVILALGYIVAKLLEVLVSRVLGRVGFDRVLHGGPGGNYVARVTTRPSRLVGRITFWAVILGAISLAASALGIAALKNFVAAIFAYLPNVLAAFLIFLVAGALAAGIAGFVGRVMGGTGLGRIVSTAVPILIMTIATFMILDQLKIAHNIVTITYAALVGAIALGSALAFGLGGREVAGRMLEGAYASGEANKEQMKRDLWQARERARREAERGERQFERPPQPVDVAATTEPLTREQTVGAGAHAPASEPADGPAHESAHEPTHEPTTRQR